MLEDFNKFYKKTPILDKTLVYHMQNLASLYVTINKTGWRNLATEYHNMGRINDALQVCEQALKKYKDSEDLLCLKKEILKK